MINQAEPLTGPVAHEPLEFTVCLLVDFRAPQVPTWVSTWGSSWADRQSQDCTATPPRHSHSPQRRNETHVRKKTPITSQHCASPRLASPAMLDLPCALLHAHMARHRHVELCFSPDSWQPIPCPRQGLRLGLIFDRPEGGSWTSGISPFAAPLFTLLGRFAAPRGETGTPSVGRRAAFWIAGSGLSCKRRI